MDSTDLKSIRPYLPKDIQFDTQPTEVEFTELQNIFKKLSKLESNQAPPYDGITIYLETKNSKKLFFSPNKNSAEGKLIIKTYELLGKLFEDQTKLEDAIEILKDISIKNPF